MAEFAVIDCETTGVLNNDRVIELAIVVLNEKLEVVDELDSLIDPMRDLGPIHIHGITQAMMSNAPTFGDLLPSIAQLLHGRVLVAHNLNFDARFLKNEFARHDGQLNPGVGFCTYKSTGEKLHQACNRIGFDLMSAHRALADARGAAALMKRYFPSEFRTSVAEATPRDVSQIRTLSRDATGSVSEPNNPLRRIVSRARFGSTEKTHLRYLHLLDYVLDDLVITSEEAGSLKALQRSEGLSSEEIRRIHDGYFDSMLFAAHRDKVITEAEHAMLNRVAGLLGISKERVPDITWRPTELDAITPGTRISFTGVKADNKFTLEANAAKFGLQPVAFSKKNCDMLIARDRESQSGKAVKARHWGIPIMDVKAFTRLVT